LIELLIRNHPKFFQVKNQPNLYDQASVSEGLDSPGPSLLENELRRNNVPLSQRRKLS
jgi:hypothetical protein